MIVVPQGDEDGSDFAQAGQKSEQMGQPLRHVEQIAGNEDPIGTEFVDRFDDAVMTGLIAVEMQVAQVHGTATGQRSVRTGEFGYGMCGEAEFPVRNEAEKPVERFAQTVADEGSDPIGPGHPPPRHLMTRSNSVRSCSVTRYPRS